MKDELCKYRILDIKRFMNQGKADRKTEPQTECDTNCPFWDDRAGVCMRIGKCPTVKDKPHTERNE